MSTPSTPSTMYAEFVSENIQSEEIRLAPILVNCKELRVLRQNVNNDNVLRILRSENPTEKDLRLNCNEDYEHISYLHARLVYFK